MARSKPNILIIQSGGCTAVMNRSLFGLVSEASGHAAFGEIYGADHGIEGVLSGSLIDLRRPSGAAWRRTAGTPGAALGSTRTKPTPDDLAAMLDMMSSRSVGYLFIIGGNDSADTGHAISSRSREAGHDLTVITVPKTVDNDLVATDHSPGYGSAARFVALATMGAGRDAEAMGRASPVTVLEVMGRDAGWLAASAALARREERDAPHLVCVPEVPVDEEAFVARVDDACRRYGFAVAVVAENARGPDGVLGGGGEPWLVDDFGHPYYDGPGRHLAALVSKRLGVRARYEKPGTIQRSFAASVSRTDANEAEMAGRAAVRYALQGHTDQMVTLVRGSSEPYDCTTGAAPLAQVAGKVQRMPSAFLDAGSSFVTQAFLAYAMPLIGAPLPRFGRLL